MTDLPYDTLRRVMDETKELNRQADCRVNSLAEMLRGRLRQVNSSTLAALKRELRDFNASTNRWKEQG